MQTSLQLAKQVLDARQRTFDLVSDLTDEQLLGPYLPIVNPLLWEIGHVAWFQEKWVLGHVRRQKPIRKDGDVLYDSANVPHRTRWALPLPSREETLAYMRKVRDQVVDGLEKSEPDPEETYFVLLSVFHEDMHDEAITYTRQTLEYRPPRLSSVSEVAHRHGVRVEMTSQEGGPWPGDVDVPGGRFLLGAKQEEAFVFDNEKWAHPIEVKPFRIARAPVTQAEFAAFVDDDGYLGREFWSEKGWHWRNTAHARHPMYWRRDSNGGWLRRHFDRWIPLEPHLPIIHVNWYEAEAFCAYTGRRLPTEAEWEVTAAAEPDAEGWRIGRNKRLYPWGDQAPTCSHANLNSCSMGCIDVGAFPEGDSAFGCRQMMGNVWEWTSSDFLPFPGFVADPYKEYSQPWFGTHKVLRGGCWATRGRLIRNTWRNFYTPERQDVLAGFRTCALDDSK